MLGSLSLAALGVFAASITPSVARAAATPIIHWDPSNIYAGQNNNLPWGPVGMRVTVHGDQFPPTENLRIVLSPGNSNNDPAVCQNITAGVGGVAVDNGGRFSLSFDWPAAAGQVNGAYSVCSYEGMNGGVQSTANDGPFTVLAASPPRLSASPTSDVKPGAIVTITGQNWVPPQPVDVVISSSSGHTLVSGKIDSQGLNTGSFSQKVTIPSNAAKGAYTISASAKGGRLSAKDPTAISVIAASPVVTPTVAPTHAPTQAPTSVPTTAPVSPVTNTTTSGPNWLVIGLAIAAGLLLLVLVGLLSFILARRRQPPSPPAATSTAAAQPEPWHSGGAPSSAPIAEPGYGQQAWPPREPAAQPYGVPAGPQSPASPYGQEVYQREADGASPYAPPYPAQPRPMSSAAETGYPPSHEPYPRNPSEPYAPQVPNSRDMGGYPPPDSFTPEQRPNPARYPRYEPRSHPLPGVRSPEGYPPGYPPEYPHREMEGYPPRALPELGQPPYSEDQPGLPGKHQPGSSLPYEPGER